MRLTSPVLLLMLSCSGSSSGGRPSTSQNIDAQDGSAQDGSAQNDEASENPADVEVPDSSLNPECVSHAPGMICQVSSGAIVNVDGSVSNGTETCQSLCGPSQYEVSCYKAAPDPSLVCAVIVTPANLPYTLSYCCSGED